MCIACEIKNGGRTEILDNPSTNYKIYIENVANIFRLHMTNGRHHSTRDIYYCPFCGSKLTNK